MTPWIGPILAALLTLGALCSPSIASAKPADLPGDVEQQCPDDGDGRHGEGRRRRPDDLAPQTSTPTPNDLQARHLFAIAERCRAAGDHDKARTCYEEVHLLSPTSLHGRLAMDRLWEMDVRARWRQWQETRQKPETPFVREISEEQEAPAERQLQREPTERRGENLEPTSRRSRQTIRPVDDDARHREMLRSTQPLETQPEQLLEDDETEAIQYDEVPPVAFTGPQRDSPRRMPLADEEVTDEPKTTSPRSWTPGLDFQGGRCGYGAQVETDFKHRTVQLPWGEWVSRSLCGLRFLDWSPLCVVKQDYREFVRYGAVESDGGCIVLPQPQFVGEVEHTVQFQCDSKLARQATSLPVDLKWRDLDRPQQFDYRNLNSFRGQAIKISARDCFDRCRLLSFGQPLLILIAPVEEEVRGFVDSDGPSLPHPLGDFPFPSAPGGPYFVVPAPPADGQSGFDVGTSFRF